MIAPLVVALFVCGVLLHVFRRYAPGTPLPPHLAAFVHASLKGAEGGVVDVHMHAVGMQPHVSGCCLHAHAWSPWHPLSYLKSLLFSLALGITGRRFRTSDTSIVETLVAHMRHANSYVRYRGVLLAFDAVYDVDGNRSGAHTTMECPSEYVLRVANAHPDVLLPCCSVHPYRRDAVAKLEQYHAAGVRVVKWLPNSQFIDPDHELCIPFYHAMSRLGMTLLCHVGDEHSVNTGGVDQSLGDPRKLRSALDHGVRVIMAHCASEGATRDGIENFNLFIGMMEEVKYRSLLFGDISAMCIVTRAKYLRKLLRFPHLHHRILYGSDYPVPCIPMLPWTLQHYAMGLISWETKRKLDELYRYNPLLFNLVLLRVIRGQRSDSKIEFALTPPFPVAAPSN